MNVEEPDKSLLATPPKNQPDLPKFINDLHASFTIEEEESSPLEPILQQYWGEQPANLNERTHTISAMTFTEKRWPMPPTIPLEQSVAESVIQVCPLFELKAITESVPDDCCDRAGKL